MRRGPKRGTILRLEGHQRAIGPGAGRAPRLVQEHEREQRGDLGIVGQPVAEQAAQVEGFGRQVATAEVRSAARGVALVEDEVDDASTDARRVVRESMSGSANGCPESATVRLARLMRWAMVASGTKKAVAISWSSSLRRR